MALRLLYNKIEEKLGSVICVCFFFSSLSFALLFEEFWCWDWAEKYGWIFSTEKQLWNMIFK